MKRLSTCCLLLLLAACQREADAPRSPAPETPATPAAEAPAAKPEGQVELADRIERDPRYLIGISYPPNINQYPGLAAELQRYSQAAVDELMQAVDGLGGEKPTAPYDLSLAFDMLAETPQIVAVAATGSSYTGGAHGNPLVARFVWLPQRKELLRPDRLITGSAGWQAVSDAVREQLHAALSQRIDGDDTEPAERAELLKSGLKMIDEGTAPDAGNFAQFEPVLDATGHVTALRFVFPPYQVGPYSDGVQTAEVPAGLLFPHVAQAYRGIFAAPAAAPTA